MARPLRVDVAGQVYHVLNRANARWHMFRRRGDFAAFEDILEEAVERAGGDIGLMAYCLMSNHWHLVLRTGKDGAMGEFVKWLSSTHAGRYRVAHGSVGLGHLYKDRYKSFLVGSEEYFLTVCRYVERNPVRVGLVVRAEQWQWSSLWRWQRGSNRAKALLSEWPIDAHGSRPRHWLRTVNTPLSDRQLEALRTSGNRCRPFGSRPWQDRIVQRYGLQSTVRQPGRPASQ